MNTNTFINLDINIVENYFRKHNQPTRIYINDQNPKLLKQFGTNEGGPSYEIYVNNNGKVVYIKTFNILDYI